MCDANLFSRDIVGWQTSHRIDRQLVCDAFNYAMARLGYPTGVMVYSDQGSQYFSRDFRALLLTNNCIFKACLDEKTVGIMRCRKASFIR